MATAETAGPIQERQRGDTPELVLDADAIEIEDEQEPVADERPDVYEEHRALLDKSPEFVETPERRHEQLRSIQRALVGTERDYVCDDQRLVCDSTGVAARLPAGTAYGMLDQTDRRRLRESVDMAASGPGVRAAMIGENAVVVDTRFDVDGDIERLPGWRLTLSVPFRALEREYGVDPQDVLVVDEDGAQTLFIDTADMRYFYRGTGESRNPEDSNTSALSESSRKYGDYHDGWLVELDEAAKDIDDVLENHVKPDGVKAAEQAGLEVHRQGDWFFVEQHSDFMPTGITRRPDLQPEGECDFLQNHAAEWLGHDALNPQRVFVQGEVTHLDGDHDTLSLPEKQWFEAKHNGVESTSFECEEFEVGQRGMRGARTTMHPERSGRLL